MQAELDPLQSGILEKGDNTLLKPTTFGQLLRNRLTAIFPQKEELFTSDQIASFIRNRKGVRREAESLGLNKRGPFTALETIDIVYQYVTTPFRRFKAREPYSRNRVLQSLNLTLDKLNLYSKQIGYDWRTNPTVNFQTFCEIRGLSQLEVNRPREN